MLLRWNEDFPLAKFSVAEDGRPILAVELPERWLDADELGLALARVAGIADRIFDESRGWLWIGGRVPDGYADLPVRTAALLDRYAARLPELLGPQSGEACEGDRTRRPRGNVRQRARRTGREGLMRGFVRIAGPALALAVTLALALAVGVVPALAPAPVAAARPDLTLVGQTTLRGPAGRGPGRGHRPTPRDQPPPRPGHPAVLLPHRVPDRAARGVALPDHRWRRQAEGLGRAGPGRLHQPAHRLRRGSRRRAVARTSR